MFGCQSCLTEFTKWTFEQAAIFPAFSSKAFCPSLADVHVPVRSASVETGSSSVPPSLRRNWQWGNHLGGRVENLGVANSRLVGGTSVAARSL